MRFTGDEHFCVRGDHLEKLKKSCRFEVVQKEIGNDTIKRLLPR